MPTKFTLISPFFQRHGIGFLDVILQTINDSGGHVSSDGIINDQYTAFNKTLDNGQLKNLDKVIYLLPKDYREHVGAVSLWKEFKSNEKQDLIRKSIKKTSDNSDESHEDLNKLINYFEDKDDKEFPDYQWLEKHWRHHQDLWHIINEFSLATQIQWYKKHSKIFEKNGSKIIDFVELDFTYSQLEDEYKVAAALKTWLMKTEVKDNTYINIWGTATSFQLAFHYLAWSSPRLKPANFIKCKTLKTATDNLRFTPLVIETVGKNLLETLESDNNKSKLSVTQQDTLAWLEKYKGFDDNFTIMLLGEKGTGKTKVVKEVYNEDTSSRDNNNQIIPINCAQFQSNPELARSELFGHVKGAFTGATKDKSGAFDNAHGKVLFLDEVHHLDKATQSMLLTALQTDDDGFFWFTPLGAISPKKSKFQLIVASNIKQDELGEFILPDLLDRISQRTLKFDALKPGPSIKNKFNIVWESMKFPENTHSPSIENNEYFDLEFTHWLTNKSRRFDGNYRDLQKISILCADYQRCRDNPRLIKQRSTLVNYIKENWRQTPRKKEINIENFFDKDNNLSLKEITNEFKAKLVRSAEFLCGDQKSAVKMLGISVKNLIEIKKRDDS